MNVNFLNIISRNLGKSSGGVFSVRSGRPFAFKFGQIATIVSKANRDPDYKRKAPFPYKEKDVSLARTVIDRTTDRFDENSKIIVVDGPIAVGKTKFAQQLAEELDMLFVPEANMDTVYINSYGFDLRSLDDKLPLNVQSTDEKSFCREPILRNAATFQFAMLELRFSMYIDALAHVMNTGQGVVMVRSVYSELVFAEAMAKVNYIRKPVLNGYYFTRNEVFAELLRPHVQIYLDIPVPTVQQRIRERGHDWEVNGKALTEPFLQAMEDAYKKKYLPDIEKHAELLIYDWTEYGDIELVVEDLESLNFDKYTVYDTKMADWRFPKEQYVSDLRRQYTNMDEKKELLTMLDLPLPDCPELYMTGGEEELYDTIVMEAPENRYIKGYNKPMGDSILFKMKREKQHYPYHGW